MGRGNEALVGRQIRCLPDGEGAAQQRLRAPEEFLWQYVRSTPLAGAVAPVDDGRRGLLERDVIAKWQEFVEDHALVLQVRVVVATARK